MKSIKLHFELSRKSKLLQSLTPLQRRGYTSAMTFSNELSPLLINSKKNFINGAWVEPLTKQGLDVINPATKQLVASVSQGNKADVDSAVKAAHQAFDSYSQTSVDYRCELLKAIVSEFETRADDMARVITAEIGAPVSMSRQQQVERGIGHFRNYLQLLNTVSFSEKYKDYTCYKQPVGVCALITPWNWPIHQISLKVSAALAAGCTVVLKPSELAPLNAIVFSEILEKAGVPKGVFNLVQGTGPCVGEALCAHPKIDMVSFTGSTRAGKRVAEVASSTVKRVAQELGGKSPAIVLPGLSKRDIDEATSKVLRQVYNNTGQSCSAPTRLFVHKDDIEQVKNLVIEKTKQVKLGDPLDSKTFTGPLAHQQQYRKVQDYIRFGIEEGAQLLIGGLGNPKGLETGYYVKPTVFLAKNSMKIAQDEIFGPVICLIVYETSTQAIQLANESKYGLSALVFGPKEKALQIAKQLRVGSIHINGKQPKDDKAPVGGFKQSGQKREGGLAGLEDFLESTAITVFE